MEIVGSIHTNHLEQLTECFDVTEEKNIFAKKFLGEKVKRLVYYVVVDKKE